MNHMQQFKEKVERLEAHIRQLKLESTAKQKMIGDKKQEKAQLVLSSFGSTADNKKAIEKLNNDIKDLENEVQQIYEQVSLYESEIKNILRADVPELEEERKQLVQEYNEKIKEMKLKIFEEKLKFMKVLEDAGAMQRDLQNEVNEYNALINKYGDKKSHVGLEKIVIHNPQYLIHGDGSPEPIAPTDMEIEMLGNPQSRVGRLPYSYLLYKLTGEVIMSEKEARQRYNEIKK